jgi:hypothetical protein
MHSKQRKRVFVVEIEKRQIVRKTSESRLIICADCRSESDFISLRQASSIFSTAERQLLDFISENHSHYKTNEQGEIFICLNSFIEAVNKKTDNSKVKLLGANNENQQ